MSWSGGQDVRFASGIGALTTLVGAVLIVGYSRPAPWLLTGLAISAGSTGWLLRAAVSPIRATRKGAGARRWSGKRQSSGDGSTTSTPTLDQRWSVQVSDVKGALSDLRSPTRLALNPLCGMPVLTSDGASPASIRALLVNVVSKLATSSRPRDQEAGRLLLDYYVKRVGSHAVVMERLHLSRPTFYRRLRRGFELVAQNLNEMNGVAPDRWPGQDLSLVVEPDLAVVASMPT